MKLRLLDLFSGIGGFSLGLERTGGFETVAFCERELFCQKVLGKHWAGVPIYDDVCGLTGAKLAADGIAGIDAIAGGFPCQDISAAGKGAGIEGARSGLWKEYARLIGEVRPRIVFVENVRMLLGRGMSTVCGDLADLGYDAEWHVIPAAAVGAPHRRERVWIVVYPQGERGGAGLCETKPRRADNSSEGEIRGHLDRSRFARLLADADMQGPQGRDGEIVSECPGQFPTWSRSACRFAGNWLVEPNVGRVANGVPARVDRLKSLGNAVVPQVVELLGYAALERLAA